MNANKIGALVLAGAMIAGAIAIRGLIDDDDDGGGGDTTETSQPPADGGFDLICSTEFRDVCNALDGYDPTIEPAGITLDRLSAADAELPDAWVTLDPFPQMLVETRERGSNVPTEIHQQSLAVTQPQIATLSDRLNALTGRCATERETWACVVAVADKQWSELADGEKGTVKVGIADPATEAAGLVAFGNAVAAHYPDTALDDAPWQADFTFTSWLRDARDTLTLDSDPLDEMLVRPSAVNVAVTTAAETVTTGLGSEYGILAAEPAIVHRAVLATFADDDSSLAAELADGLIAAGWSDDDATIALPTPSTFIAIRDLWKGDI